MRETWLLLAALALAALALTACAATSVSERPTPVSQLCRAGKDCPAHYACVQHSCVP